MAGRVLVTGGAGFIGSHLCDRLLASGHAVRALDDLSTGTRENLADGVELLEGDVRDPDACARACKGIDTVFHLAAQVAIRHSVQTFRSDADVNLMGTLTMLEAASRAGVRRFVMASSMAVYADSPERRPVDEEHETTPLSPYGVSKLAAERDVLLLAPSLGLEPVVLRFFNTYGPRQGFTPYVGVATIFVTRILAGEPCTIFGDGEQCRDFTHVSDVASACVLAGEEPAAVGRVFNVGTGVGTTVNRLAELLRAELGAGSFTHVERDASELVHSVAAIDRARGVLGYEPQCALADHLGDVVASVRQRLA